MSGEGGHRTGLSEAFAGAVKTGTNTQGVAGLKSYIFTLPEAICFLCDPRNKVPRRTVAGLREGSRERSLEVSYGKDS